MNSEINEGTIVYFVMLKTKMTCQGSDLICAAFYLQLGIHCEKIEDAAKLRDRQSMALNVIKKINTRLRFLYRKNRCSKNITTPEQMNTFLFEFES